MPRLDIIQRFVSALIVGEAYVLSMAADLLKEYRKLDDSITMRLNRTTAQFRDRDRQGLVGKGSVEGEACMQIWRELVGE